eukprot:SAG31_NODE_6790_length_1887_cov_1.833333_1_plen_119_part_00
MRFAQELRFAALENIRLSDSNAADCDAELQAVRAEIALLEDAADPATAGKKEVDERRDISSKETADATVLARLPGMTREQLEEELYSRAGPKATVRSVTFSFLWDFSRFHGTDREIRD